MLPKPDINVVLKEKINSTLITILKHEYYVGIKFCGALSPLQYFVQIKC